MSKDQSPVSAGRWVKASDQLPPSLDLTEVHYMLDGKKSNGILIESADGFFTFEWAECGLYRTITDLSRVEWLDETPDVNTDTETEFRAINEGLRIFRNEYMRGFEEKMAEVDYWKKRCEELTTALENIHACVSGQMAMSPGQAIAEADYICKNALKTMKKTPFLEIVPKA